MSSKNLAQRFQFIQAIRDFFNERGFVDVITPPMVENPGMEVHIHPFQTITHDNKKDLYLHTSPEFKMKELLSTNEIENIFTISYCFRNEPSSPIHRKQFLMLEWYRLNARYEKIMKDTEELVTYLSKKFDSPLANENVTHFTIQEVFRKYLDIDILNFSNKNQIISLIKNNFSNNIKIPDTECEWDDYFFLIFLNLIEPKLKDYPLLILKEYPAQLAALSTIKESDKRVCERFELYVNGIEVANCFNELTDLKEQIRRFNEQNELKRKLYGYQLPNPDSFYQSLQRGLGPCSGTALGVERLMGEVLEIKQTFWD